MSLLRVPFRLLFPAIVLFCCIGAYSAANIVFDIWVLLVFGVLGVFFFKVSAGARAALCWVSCSGR